MVSFRIERERDRETDRQTEEETKGERIDENKQTIWRRLKNGKVFK